jgi:hypothetical protein
MSDFYTIVERPDLPDGTFIPAMCCGCGKSVPGGSPALLTICHDCLMKVCGTTNFAF